MLKNAYVNALALLLQAWNAEPMQLGTSKAANVNVTPLLQQLSHVVSISHLIKIQ